MDKMITDIQARNIQDWLVNDPDRVTDVMQSHLSKWLRWKRYVKQNPGRSIDFAKECLVEAEKENNKKRKRQTCCQRCGRENHHIMDCNESFDINGEEISDTTT